MGWYIALGVVVLLAILPVGVSASYCEAGFRGKLLVGPMGLTLYPRKKKQEKQVKQEKQAPAPDGEKTTTPPAAEKKGGKLTDFLPLGKLALRFLNELRRKIRVKRLEVKLILAGDDPCDLAVNYGRAWAAVGNVLPQLERVFTIQKRKVEVECDFRETETKIVARLDVTITLGRLLVIAVTYGIRALKEYQNMKSKRKGGVMK